MKRRDLWTFTMHGWYPDYFFHKGGRLPNCRANFAAGFLRSAFRLEIP